MHIDLHTHSTASDGTDTPAELVRNAAAAGLDVVALTDHDTVRGHAEAIAALPEGLTLVTGAELSCRIDGVGLHMLAYLFDPDEPELARERELVRDDRVPRAQTMVRKLQALGVPVEWEQVARIMRRRIGRQAAHRHRARRARCRRDRLRRLHSRVARQRWTRIRREARTRPLRRDPAGQGRRWRHRLRAPARRQAR